MAADINVVMLVGRLTRDAELKYTNTGFPIGKFSLAVNRRRKSGDEWIEEGHFFDISLLGKRAEALTQYLTKGTQVAIQGELRQNRWEQDGQPRSKVEITANDIQLLGGGRNASGGSGKGSQNNYSNRGGTGSGEPSGTEDTFDDDIPF
jgi:single-strand DNA-binding protein